MAFDVTYELAGVVNGMNVDVRGKGRLDAQAGVYELDVKFDRIPMGWDPAFIIMICCDRMLGFPAKELAGAKNLRSKFGGGYNIHEREFPTYRANGAPICRGRASSVGHVSETGDNSGSIFNRSQIIESNFYLGLDEKIERIHTPYKAVLRQAPSGQFLLSSLFSFDTNDDKNCWGHCEYPIYHKTPQHSFSDNVNVTNVKRVEFKNHRDRNGGVDFSFVVESEVSDVRFP